MHQKKPVVLMILDGWGYSEKSAWNAITTAHTPQWDAWWASQPHILLNASGLDVGLPEQQMGNSEVGHMHIGAGRVIYQDFTRINQAIVAGEFAHNRAFLQLIDSLKSSQKTLHIMGLLSNGGVHSHENHLFAFLKLCYQHNIRNMCLHLFLDGRDTPPQSALGSIHALEQTLSCYPVGRIASISGRYYAMDRDNRWERIEAVYRMLTKKESAYHFANASSAVKTFYQQAIYDEFIPPTLIGIEQNIDDGDAIFFFNFRSDRARQLTQAFVDTDFNHFIREPHPSLSHFVSMTRYAKHISTDIAFEPIELHNTLGEIVASHNLSQLRIAETEKYAHVTFFFNGGSEHIFVNEDRILIPSPAVATYDLLPEMSAPQLTQALIGAINSDKYDVIICNYANADMVGHSGNFAATIKAIECLDTCMQQIGKALAAKDGAMLITADHGNAEAMFDDQTHQAHTAHTSEPVPLVYVGNGWHFNAERGSLADIAPTLLTLLGLSCPAEMTGNSLLVENYVQIS